MIDVHIPVKAHVKKYLIKKYGQVHTVSRTSFIGMQLLHALSRKMEKPNKTIPPQIRYQVTVPELYYNTKGHTVPRNVLQYLGNCLEKLFNEEFFAHIDIQVGKGCNALPEMKHFLKYYEITEDEARLDSLYRAYQRHCRGPIKNKKSCA